MEEREAELFVYQIRNILKNIPLTSDIKVQTEKAKRLQEGFDYLSACMMEFQEFMQQVCAGNLDIETPDKRNFLAGYLKELHSILRHLTWQASQVAEGDYNQRVNFLGEFSVSFNKMIEQLEEREDKLKKNTEALSSTMDFLSSILNKQEEWIIVLDGEAEEIVFANDSASREFCSSLNGHCLCGEKCQLREQLLKYRGEREFSREYRCNVCGRVLETKGSPIRWAGKDAYVFYISDITAQMLEKEELHNMAYEDALTRLYNRRFCLEELGGLLARRHPLSMVLVDLDGLKRINDVYGHNEGDTYLITAADILKRNTRAQDVVGRIGGDEFLVLLPGCSEEAAHRKMEVAAKEVANAGGELEYCISYGIVHKQGESVLPVKELMDMADTRMYSMKKRNKNGKKAPVS